MKNLSKWIFATLFLALGSNANAASYSYLDIGLAIGEYDDIELDYDAFTLAFSHDFAENPLHLFVDYNPYHSDEINGGGSSVELEFQFLTLGLGWHGSFGEESPLSWYANAGAERLKVTVDGNLQSLAFSGSDSEWGYSLGGGLRFGIGEGGELELAVKQPLIEFDDNSEFDELYYRFTARYKLSDLWWINASYEAFQDTLSGFRIAFRADFGGSE